MKPEDRDALKGGLLFFVLLMAILASSYLLAALAIEVFQ